MSRCYVHWWVDFVRKLASFRTLLLRVLLYWTSAKAQTFTRTLSRWSCSYTVDFTDLTSVCMGVWLCCTGHVHARSGVLNIILGIVVTAIVVVVLAFCFVQLRRRRRRKKHETVTVHFLAGSAVDTAAAAAAAAHSNDQSQAANGGHHLFTEQTEKVSILWDCYYTWFSSLHVWGTYTPPGKRSDVFMAGTIVGAGASIPMGQGGHVPPIFMKGGHP